MIITEDTPEGGPEELQWKIDRLTEKVEQQSASLEREYQKRAAKVEELHALQARYDTLTSRLTVGVLRAAGFTVEIGLPEFCETCGEEY